MKCTQVLKHIPLLVGGDLDAGTGQKLMEHLKGCLRCFREYQESRRAVEDLRVLRERPDLLPVLNGLAQDVLVDLNAAPAGPAARFPKPWLTGVLQVAAAAAVIMILAGGAFMLGRSQGTSPGAAVDPTGTVKTLPSFEDERNAYPPGLWTNERGPYGEDGETEFITLRPQQLPDVRPATHRRGF